MHTTEPSSSKNLNQEQLDAIEHVEGPLLVLAGAGSGKTRVVTQRIVRLIEKGVPPEAILGLTFTNKAAGEMQARVRSLMHCNVLVCTFHSLGARILRESIHALGYERHFAIYDEDDSEKVLKSCLEDIGVKDEKLEPKVFRQMISRAKNALVAPESIKPEEGAGIAESLFPTIYAAYQKRLKEYVAVDFDDLLYLTVRLFREHSEILKRYQKRWRFLLIDEYQDTNASQYEMVRLLVSDHGNLCVVGDPDQSIYSWRGANIKNILHFEQDYPGAKIVRLEQNYRSRSNILEAANALVSYNKDRYEKNLWSDLGAGEKLQIHATESDRDEVRFVIDSISRHRSRGVPLNEMVVFYRTNFQSRIFEDALLSRQIPYVIVGGISFYQRREIKDVLAYLRMVQSSHDFISFERTINVPKRGIGPTTIDKLRDAASEAGQGIFDFCEQFVTFPQDGPLRLTAKQKAAIGQYVSIIQQLREQRDRVELRELIEGVIESTGYGVSLAEDQESQEDRWENLRELVTIAAQWQESHDEASLVDFLEELSLKSSLDAVDESEQRINLMTLHNGKGLEFTVTFLVGMEEELFPHANSRSSDEALEEERRLCYVGMTRAKEFLYLTHTKSRYLWGTFRRMRPSRFLKEIPAHFVEQTGQSRWPPASIAHNFEPVDRHFEEEEPAPPESPELPFKEGDLVFHREFGKGEIESVYESTVGLTYRIFFTRDRVRKTLVGKFAKLSKV